MIHWRCVIERVFVDGWPRFIATCDQCTWWATGKSIYTVAAAWEQHAIDSNP